MHLDDTESDQLKGWIVKRLEDISDADSDVLADYVLALVKSDETDDQVRQNCQENLDDFLKQHTGEFVDDVFKVIATKSYDASSPANVPSTLSVAAPEFNPPTGPLGTLGRRQSISNGQNQQARKRNFNDWDGAEGQNGNGPNGRDRPMKQMRRAGGRGGYDQRGGRIGQGNMAPLGLPQMPTPPPGMPPFDPNNPFAALMAMQAMGVPSLPGMPSFPIASSPGAFPQSVSLPQKRTGERCKDYDTKGFCALGASCPYEHGNDHYTIPNKQNDEYDPTNASLSGGQEPRGYNDRGRGRGRGRGDRGAFRGARGGRADFSMAGPNNDQSITSIVVEQIPEDKFEEQTVRDFFSEFGNIEEITLQPYKRLAIIKYDSYTGARAAYDSPKVIFDNRFIKVYWYKPDRLPRQPEGYRNGAHNRNKPQDEDVDMQQEEAEEDKIDPVELAKKQKEAQKAHEEKMKKIKEAESQREELEKKVKAQAEERSALLAKLAAKERAKSGTPDVSGQAASGASAAKTPSQTDALKAKLAELEREAESMGINPNEEAQPWQGFAPRGRGGYRGRATYTPRGAWRGGRGGFAPRGGAVMRLDNRPRSIAVVFANGEEMGSEKDEALRQYLLFVSFLSTSPASSCSFC